MIYDLAVAPDHQRRGIGRAIVQSLIARSSASSIGLFTENKEPLIAFYKSLGFKPIQGMELRNDQA